jgi:MFS family permease
MTSAASEDTHRDLVSSSGASALELIKNFAGADLVSDSPRLKLPGSAVEPEPARTQQTETLGSVQPACGNNRRSSWQLLGQHDFRLYFLGNLTSNLGTWLQSTAQVLIAYQVTHSVFTVGLIASAQFAGMVVVSPWAPVLADRVSPTAILIGTQFASAAIAASMAWRYLDGMLGVHSLIIGALGLGFAYSLGLPIQAALVPKLVREEADVTNAVKMNSVSYNAGRALAPALCVLVITCIGPDLIFILNAISFVIFAVLLCRLKHITDDKAPPGHPRARVTDGLMIALRHRRILLLLAIVAAVTLADDPILVLSPALAHSKLHITSEGAGYFIAALGWGSVLGSLPPTLTKDYSARRASRYAAFWLLVLAVSVVVFTMGFSIAVSLAAAIVAGAAGLFTGTAAQTALLGHQKTTVDIAAVTSVAALWAIAWAGTKPFASLLDGWLASHTDIVFTTIVLAAPAVIIALCELLLPEGAKRGIILCAKRISYRPTPPTSIHPGTEPPPPPDPADRSSLSQGEGLTCRPDRNYTLPGHAPAPSVRRFVPDEITGPIVTTVIPEISLDASLDYAERMPDITESNGGRRDLEVV